MPRPVTCCRVSTAVTSNGSASATVKVPFHAGNRHADAAAGDVVGDQREDRLVDGHAVQVDRFGAGLTGQETRPGLPAEKAELDQDIAQAPAVALLLALGQFELHVHQQARVDKLLAQRHFLLYGGHPRFNRDYLIGDLKQGLYVRV